MTREEAEQIVTCYDDYKRNRSSERGLVLRSFQQRHPSVRFFDDDGLPTREFKRFVAGLRKFIHQARKLDQLENRPTAKFADGIVVFGSCHLDVWGDVKDSEPGVIDQPGSIAYSVGGTAYNIAHNLSSRGLPVAIFSYIRAGSAVSDYILRRIREAGISDYYLQRVINFPESAFIAHRINGELVSAVSSMAIETHGRFEHAQVRDAIKKSRVVVIECNLSETQIELISRLAVREERPVLCAAVSEPKASRILASYRPAHGAGLLAVCMNDYEFATIAKKCGISDEVAEILEKLNSRAVFITRGAAGYDILSVDTTIRTHFPAPRVTTLVNTSGAGDALLSGLIHSIYCSNGELDVDDCRVRIEDYVKAVLGEVGSTVGAAVDPSEIVHRTVEVSAETKEHPRNFLQKVVHYTWKAWSIPVIIVGILAVPAFFFSDECEKLFAFMLRHLVDALHWLARLFSGK
jgi:sugar/nucleoside kinase (ribokinase family)